MFSVTQVDRAPARCLGGHRFESFQGLSSLSHGYLLRHGYLLLSSVTSSLQCGCRSLSILLSQPCFYTD